MPEIKPPVAVKYGLSKEPIKDPFDRGEAGVIPKRETIKKLFINKNFIILILVTVFIGGTVQTFKYIKETRARTDSILIGIQNGSLTRTVINQAEQINFLNECNKTKSIEECQSELTKSLK